MYFWLLETKTMCQCFYKSLHHSSYSTGLKYGLHKGQTCRKKGRKFDLFFSNKKLTATCFWFCLFKKEMTTSKFHGGLQMLT